MVRQGDEEHDVMEDKIRARCNRGDNFTAEGCPKEEERN